MATIVLPCGPGKETVIDTLESIAQYCPEPHNVVIIDDCTGDGTYEAIKSVQRKNWHILRNEKPNGIYRLVHTLCTAYYYVLKNLSSDLILRLDQDALLINQGVITDALSFMKENPSDGLFGVYEVDYNRPRSFSSHMKLINREMAFWRTMLGIRPSWRNLLAIAESKGYQRGDNVFGGAYFITRDCLAAIQNIGGLDVPYSWHSQMQEDVYFSMTTVAAGYRMGHFAWPSGPLCLEWRGLPFPAMELWKRGYKIVHSVDKGINTGTAENNGLTAREVFRNIRYNV